MFNKYFLKFSYATVINGDNSDYPYQIFVYAVYLIKNREKFILVKNFKLKTKEELLECDYIMHSNNKMLIECYLRQVNSKKLIKKLGSNNGKNNNN